MGGIMDRVIWLGHAGIALDLPPLVVIDPHGITQSSRKADLILVTHPHYDHTDPDSIRVLAGPGTSFVGPEEAVAKLPRGAISMKPGQKMVVAGVEIEAVPAYNIGKQFHLKEKGWVGYIVRHGGVACYHAGDTDLIPEMDSISCDVAFLPVGGKYTMTAVEAAEAVMHIRPKFAVPIHYGTVVGSAHDAEAFVKACPPGVEVLVPPIRRL
jgi:L-ascorbate metabolism protein UlaG (beta-lactamase superfamily)